MLCIWCPELTHLAIGRLWPWPECPPLSPSLQPWSLAFYPIRLSLTSVDSTYRSRGRLTTGSMHKVREDPVNLPCDQRIDAFKLWCWRRLLRVPWTARRSDQSILREINPVYSLEELILKLKLQYFGHPMRRAYLLEKTLMLGKTEGTRRGWKRMRWLDSITKSIDMNMSKFLEIVKDREAWHAAVHGITKSQIWLSDWTTTTI